jgi:hypothetical protein
MFLFGAGAGAFILRIRPSNSAAGLAASNVSAVPLEQVPINWNRTSQHERPETLPESHSEPGRRTVLSAISAFQMHWAPKPVPSSLRSGGPFIRRPPTTIAPFPSPSRGRDAPPAQIRTSGFPAYGSCLGCLTANLVRACRTLSRPCGAPSRPCVRSVRSCPAFPLAPALRSTGSAAGSPALFACFAATMAGSDFSRPFAMRFGSSPSACGPGRPMACGRA